MKIPEDPVFGTWYYLSFKFFVLVPGTKCSSKIFQNSFRSKNKVFGPVKMPKVIPVQILNVK
jgi:hypothetical protein